MQERRCEVLVCGGGLGGVASYRAPRAVRARPELLNSFQRVLDAAGIERAWPR